MATGGGALENIKEEENFQLQDHLINPQDRDVALSPTSQNQQTAQKSAKARQSGRSSLQPSSRGNRAAIVSPEAHSYESEYDEEYDPSSSEQTI